MDMTVSKEKVLSLLKTRGPSVPADMTRALGTDTILIGALLSQLVSDGSVLVTQAKIGGSKLYYVKQDLAKIVRLRPHLNEKDQRTFDLLLEKKVLRDDEMTPLQRTSLRNLPDFALPVKVHMKGTEVLFWRWFIVNTDEARSLIEKKIGIVKHIAQQPQLASEPAAQSAPKVEEKKQEAPVEQLITETKPTQSQISELEQTPKQNEFIKQKKTVEKRKNKTEQKTLKDENPLQAEYIEDEMIVQLTTVLGKKEITLLEYTTIRKNKEYDVIALVPTPVGNLKFFGKFRAKKTVSEGDVCSALLVAQRQQLPLLVITTGKVVKKVKGNQDDLYNQVVFLETIFD